MPVVAVNDVTVNVLSISIVSIFENVISPAIVRTFGVFNESVPPVSLIVSFGAKVPSVSILSRVKVSARFPSSMINSVAGLAKIISGLAVLVSSLNAPAKSCNCNVLTTSSKVMVCVANTLFICTFSVLLKAILNQSPAAAPVNIALPSKFAAAPLDISVLSPPTPFQVKAGTALSSNCRLSFSPVAPRINKSPLKEPLKTVVPPPLFVIVQSPAPSSVTTKSEATVSPSSTIVRSTMLGVGLLLVPSVSKFSVMPSPPVTSITLVMFSEPPSWS